MRLYRRGAALAAAALFAAVPWRLAAQTDYRNLDDDRPSRVEDASPVERYAFEFLVPFSYARERPGSVFQSSALELAYGILPNAHVGLKAPFTKRGLARLRAFALYNVNTESTLLPAVALRADASFPVGPLGGDATQVSLKGIVTRSWGRNRLHVNGAVRLGRDAQRTLVEGLERWWYGVAVDHTLFRHSLLVIGDVYASRAVDAAPVEVNASLGLRWQWRPTTVIDLGVRRRLRDNVGPDYAVTIGVSNAFAIAGLMPRRRSTRSTRATQDRRSEQFFYPGSFNWSFLRSYPEAARLFNAFDYGHAVLYERLYTLPDSGAVAAALEREYRYLTTDLLVRPPRFAVAEAVIEPAYAKLAWRATLMFEWAHVLHRQVYDVYADEAIPTATQDTLIERLTDYYLSRGDIAFAPVPKSMALMDEQYYSQIFRKRFAKFNGLIWAYHWLQVGLYEPFIAGRTPQEKKAGVQAAVARFWQMLEGPPGSMPRVMPLTATVAPEFTRRHPRAGAIFDNLHMMHDIISDILASEKVARESKRTVIDGVLAEFRDSTRNVLTHDEWLKMGHHMGGIDAMGGPAVGLLRSERRPTTAQPHEHRP